MDTMMLYSFFVVVVSLPTLWLLFKAMHKRGQLTENVFVFLVAGYSWFAVLTLSRAISTTKEFKAISFILFLLLWYPTIHVFRKIYRKIFQ